jgi:hypothetical protein
VSSDTRDDLSSRLDPAIEHEASDADAPRAATLTRADLLVGLVLVGWALVSLALLLIIVGRTD